MCREVKRGLSGRKSGFNPENRNSAVFQMPVAFFCRFVFRPPVGGPPLAHWYRAGAPPKGGLLQRTGCDRVRDLAGVSARNFTVCEHCGTNLILLFMQKKWQLSTICTQAKAPHALQEHMASEVSFPRSVLESYTDRQYHNTAPYEASLHCCFQRNRS